MSGALAAGLPSLRERSSPERLSWEARRFVDLLAAAAAEKDDERLAALTRDEVRAGALAVTSSEGLGAVFALWRRVLAATTAALGLPGFTEEALRGVFAPLEAHVEDALRRWLPARVDLVCIGASAGGIAALQELLFELGPEIAATLLVLLHVSPGAPSTLAAILARQSRLTIVPAVDGAPLYLGHAYVAPPRRHLVVDAGRLKLDERPPVHHVRPSVDVLLESAAAWSGEHLATVVLSGTGADGAEGTRAALARGAITFAQDPGTAQFRGMADAAIATGAVRYVLPLISLRRALTTIIREGRHAPLP